MATVAESKPVRKITRKRAGYKRVVVELTDNHYEELSKLAVADIRRGGPTEMLSVLCRLNLDALIKAHRPAQLALTDDKPSKDGQFEVAALEAVRLQRQERVDKQPLPKSPEVTYSATKPDGDE